MFEVVDHPDPSFLSKYEKYFIDQKEKVQKKATGPLASLPQFKIDDYDFNIDFMSNFEHVYPGWIRCNSFSYVFRFQPDLPSMLPHIDIDPESGERGKGKIKRILIYANPVWKPEWKGGTYFAPFESYKVNRRMAAVVKTETFAAEASLVENVPGRAVVFDPCEIHMPQEFSGNNVQRLIFGAMLVHPDYPELEELLYGPDNDNGNSVTKLDLP